MGFIDPNTIETLITVQHETPMDQKKDLPIEI